MKLADRIVADPDTCSGHPRIEGTRVLFLEGTPEDMGR